MTADKPLGHIVRAFVLVAMIVSAWGAPARALEGFPAAVERILMNQSDGLISTLSTESKQELITCVKEVLTAMPNGMQRFVLAATDYGEMEDRFGKVLLDNRAEWKQNIARSCAHLAV